jgi:hypothetical protein
LLHAELDKLDLLGALAHDSIPTSRAMTRANHILYVRSTILSNPAAPPPQDLCL